MFDGDEGPKRVATTAEEPPPALEHRRYIAARLADGWQQASFRSDALCRHPVFVPYDELGADLQRNDRRMTRVLTAAVTGDPQPAAERARGAKRDHSDPGVRKSLERAFARLADHRRTVQPERCIGVIGPIGGCAGRDRALDGASPAAAILPWPPATLVRM